jgi:hypothetical protein
VTTAALQLSVLDQSLNEVSAVEKLAGRIDRLVKVGRSVGLHARFISSVVRAWHPTSFTTTADVWDAAEKIEPFWFGLYSSVYAVKRPRPSDRREDDLPWLSEDLNLRLTYVQRLMADVPDNTRTLSPRQQRQRQQRLLDDPSVPPSVRLVLCQARSLPVLLFLSYCVESSSDFNGGCARELVSQATREGLDSLIAFAVGICERDGKQAIQPPNALRSSLPPPMDIRVLEERWQPVQAAWCS